MERFKIFLVSKGEMFIEFSFIIIIVKSVLKKYGFRIERKYIGNCYSFYKEKLENIF